MTRPPGIDVSYYDGHGAPYIVTDWASYTWPFVFIKVSEGTWIDALFMRQWAAARGHVLRSAYHFFRPSVDPRTSALKTVEYLRRENDLGELPLAFDLEATDGMTNVLDRAKSWLSWYEAFTGVRPIIYSSPGFLDTVKAANYPFLANYKLWLSAWPFDLMEPLAVREKRIADVVSGAYVLNWPAAPAPFKRASFWQWTAQGKPGQVPGYYTGTRGKKEIDLNFYNGTEQELRAEFAVTTETPTDPPIEPPIGETMDTWKATWDNGLNKRPASNVNNTPVGVISDNTVFDVTGYFLPPGKTQAQEYWGLLNDGNWVALVYNSQVRAVRVTEAPPIPPAPEAVHPVEATIKMSDGSIHKATGFTKQ